MVLQVMQPAECVAVITEQMHRLEGVTAAAELVHAAQELLTVARQALPAAAAGAAPSALPAPARAFQQASRSSAACAERVA